MTTDYKNATYGGLTFDEAMKLQHGFTRDANAQMAKLVAKYDSFYKVFREQCDNMDEEAIEAACQELAEVVEGMQTLTRFGVEFYVAFGDYSDKLSRPINMILENLTEAGKGDWRNQTPLFEKVASVCSDVEGVEYTSYQWHNSNCY